MTTQHSTDAVIEVLAGYRRRSVLSYLIHVDGSPSLRDLATAVERRRESESGGDSTARNRDAVLSELHHVHLPQLDAAGFVTYDPETATVALRDHAALHEEWVADLIGSPAEPADRPRDETLAALTAPRRRAALSVLRDHGAVISVRDLAANVAAAEDGKPVTEVAERERAAVLASLYHVHLPNLADVGLVEYDATEGTVAARDAPSVNQVPGTDGPVDGLGDATGSDSDARAETVWTIEGRENVAAREHELIERADDELFVMVTTDGLFRDDCVARLRDAIDRGVDVYVGSQTREVCDRMRQRLAGATIWEAQLDWRNPPPGSEQLGRLVFVDRDAILLTTLCPAEQRDAVREIAVTGEGQNNSVVVLMREMLAPRLDRLDLPNEGAIESLPL